MKVKGAIFDMDGTLVESLMFWDYLWVQIGLKYMNDAGFKPSPEIDRMVRTMIYRDAMLYFKKHYCISATDEEFLHFTANGIPDFYKTVAHPKPGAVAVLEHLKGRGIKLCLASATDMHEIKMALACYDMAKYFDTVLSCADLGVGKDKPDIYLSALQKMGLVAEEVCVVEDSYVALETAKAVGFQTVGVFDRYNFGHDRLEKASDIYLDEQHTLNDLIGRIQA